MKILVIIAGCAFLTSCTRPPESSEKQEQKSSSASRNVVVKKAAQEQLGLSTTAAAVESLTEYLTVTGTVQPADSRVAHVRPIARGRLQNVLVRVGDRVRKGQPLAAFDNIEAAEVWSQYQAAEAELRKLRVAQQSAARQKQRNGRLADLGAVARKEYEASQADVQSADEAIQAQQSVVSGLATRLRRFGISPEGAGPSLATITAPMPGIVVAVSVAPGEVIEPEKELFSVVDLSTVWVQAEVYEKDVGRIRPGQTALIQVDTYADRRFTGRVAYIADVVDPKTRTVKVRCEVANEAMLLKLDMFATVNLPTIVARRAIAVPEGAIQQVNGKPIVFIRASDESFEVRPVTTGMTAYGLTEITSGLTAGELVATHGAFHLKSILLETQIAKEE